MGYNSFEPYYYCLFFNESLKIGFVAMRMQNGLDDFVFFFFFSLFFLQKTYLLA